MARLTDKQKRFVEEYLVDLNATQAAIRAGYSEKTARSQGQRMLTNDDIQTEIQKAMEERSARVEITQDRVVAELVKIAFADRGAFARVARGGRVVELTDTDELAEDQRAALAGVEETKFGIKVSTYDKVRALELLGKHLGLFDGKGGQGAGQENNLLSVITAAAEGDMDTDDLPEVE